MLAISNVSKRYNPADEPVLDRVSFVVNRGDRVGLVGPNGCGKTTLLRIIVGALDPDSGSILRTPSNLRIGYLAQDLEVPDSTAIRAVLFPHLERLTEAESTIERLAPHMGNSADDGLTTAYQRALEQMRQLTTISDDAAAERALADVGLDLSLDQPVRTLSGGQKTRVRLAALMLTQPQLIVLDEPTNHLDMDGLAWLEVWVRRFSGAALIVSHDRTFLDETVNRIVAFDAHTHTCTVYEGNYSDYAAAVRSEIDRQWAVWRDQQLELRRLREDAERAMRWANLSNAQGGDRFAAKAAKRADAKETRLERYLKSDDRVDKPRQTWKLKLDFDSLPTSGQLVLETHDLSVGYVPARPLLEKLTLHVHSGERIAITGANGGGKTTLLKTLIGELPPLGGRVRQGPSVRIGYLAQEQDTLDSDSTPFDITAQAMNSTNSTDVRSFLHYFLFTGEASLRPIRLLSLGERARLMLALAVARGANVLVLDEPINHLDVPSREQFEAALSGFQGAVLAVVHDRHFVDRFATTVWYVRPGRLDIEARNTAAL